MAGSAVSLRLLDWFVKEGWMVAVHNDYILDGARMTFWLFTKGKNFVKGEGITNTEALQAAQRAALALDREAESSRKASNDLVDANTRLLLALKFAVSRLNHHTDGCRGGAFASCRCSNAVAVRAIDRDIKKSDPSWRAEVEDDVQSGRKQA